MPRVKLTGRDRLDLRAEPEWIDLATRAAMKLGLNLSSYVRLAVTERMEQDGFSVPLPPIPEKKPAKLKRKRGRPRKEK